ncbi:GNAT family N-acetyltransferase [Clostridium sp. AL.422]|uniref:GNAT family N-acetyltransferase n=1 Tax=Clostridium TaxID=1485 RepID=UPI00293DE6DE|nr:MULTISPECIES: GNAT family N-acetyltransferase [unclassified Clostridium]MDV4152014.1 GNAT family N-acetyltransferase [Clostridium sp. AL.422]
MKIINYSQKYEEKVVNLWNECLIKDIISIEEFRKQVLFDDNFNTELALIAVEDEEVLGFILATKRQVPYLDRGLEPEKAWINIIFVKENHRQNNIGKQLVAQIEQKLLSKGTKNIILASYSPNYFFPGIDVDSYQEAIGFFEKLNYKNTGEAVSMQRSLWDYKIPDKIIEKKAKLEQSGYIFKKFDYKYSLDLLDFLGKNFGGGWKRNALMAMQNYEAEKLIWLALDNYDNVVGFCMRKMDGNDCRFGPFGVREDLRSTGIGGVLFNLMMDDMKKNKLYYLYFLWTHGAGMRFYQRHGVEIYRSYYLYSKKLI